MLHLLHEHHSTLAGLLIGLILILIFWPPPEQAAEENMRQARLAELRCGADERIFEERRELEAYGRDSAGPFRFWGILILILSLAPLLL